MTPVELPGSDVGESYYERDIKNMDISDALLSLGFLSVLGGNEVKEWRN